MRSSLRFTLSSIKKIKFQKGFSIVEVMVSVGILSVIGAGVATLGTLNQQNTLQMKATRIAMTQKEKIEAALKNPASWQATLSNNIDFRCLSEAPGCDDTVKSFVLYSVDPLEKLTFDPLDSTTRMTLNGERCPLATPDPSPLCPFKYMATWKALCTTFPCLNPPIDLKIEIQTSFENDRKVLNTKNYDYKTIKGINDNDVQSICISMNGVYNAINKTCRPKFAGRSCAAIGRPHQIVKDVLTDGSLVCEPLFTGMCPGVQVMVGINTDGSVMCGPQPVGSCPAPVNCVGSFSACTASCGGGTETFNITTLNAFGGAACSHTNGFVRACGTAPCAPNINCVGSFGACNVATGFRTFTITQPRSGTGTACSNVNGDTQACAVNCIGNWGSCSGGTQTFTQSTIARNGGLACAAAHGATQACGAVVINGSCSAVRNTCSSGLPAVFGSTATHDTWQCQGSGGGSTASCSSPRPVNCVGNWGLCSRSCGGGLQTFAITTPASGGGASCSHVTGDTQTCNSAPCAANINCVGSFGACDTSTGTRIYTITQSQSGTGTACPFTSGFSQSCPVNCVGSFSACSGGVRTYTQTLIARNGGAACPYAHGATDSCGTNGVCAAASYTCGGGTPANFRANATHNIWDCLGSSGGRDDLACPFLRPPRVDCVTGWGPCTNGTRLNSRSYKTIVTPASGGGMACPADVGVAYNSCHVPIPVACTSNNTCMDRFCTWGITQWFCSGVPRCSGASNVPGDVDRIACDNLCRTTCSRPNF